MTVAVNPSKVRTLDMKLEIVVIPVSDVDRAKQLLRRPGLEARRRLRFRRRLPRDPVHAAWLRRLGHLRQECHRGGARLRPGTVPDRLRHRGCARGAARSRRQGQRGVPRRRRRVCGSGRALPVRERPGQRSGSRAVAATARSPRSAIRTATAGCSRRSPHDFPAAWRVTRPSLRRLISRPRSVALRLRMASTRSGPASTM